MSAALTTLTTDFGVRSPFVAAMKGVLLSHRPDARLIDLSHDITPYDVRHAAFFLAAAVPCFPPGTLHVAVIDPGVGGAREILYVEVNGQQLLVPDNGCWTLLGPPSRVLLVRERRFMRPSVSPTFHGRDVFAPVAAHLGLGVDPAELGPPASEWQRLAWPAPRAVPEGLAGEVVFVDHFGNLITNLPGPDGPARVVLADGTAPRRVRTYADAAPGELVSLTSSNGALEIALVQGDAARRLGAGVGTPVRVESQP